MVKPRQYNIVGVLLFQLTRFLYLSMTYKTTAMPAAKHTQVIILVILSGLVAYRLLKHKRSGTPGHRASITPPGMSAGIRTLVHHTLKKRLAKL